MPLLQRRSDGRWLQISERRTETGGTVAVYSDLTDIKESEQRAAAANQLILQSLRYASRIQAAVLPARQRARRGGRRPFPHLGAARHRRRRLLLVPAHQRRLCRDGRRLHRPRRARRLHDLDRLGPARPHAAQRRYRQSEPGADRAASRGAKPARPGRGNRARPTMVSKPASASSIRSSAR